MPVPIHWWPFGMRGKGQLVFMEIQIEIHEDIPQELEGGALMAKDTREAALLRTFRPLKGCLICFALCDALMQSIARCCELVRSGMQRKVTYRMYDVYR